MLFDPLDPNTYSKQYQKNLTGKPKVCFVGSSLVQHANDWNNLKIATTARGWPTWLMMMWQDAVVAEQWLYQDPISGNWYNNGSNRGYSGQTSVDIDARKTDIASMEADIYIIQQGTNDLANSTLPVSTTIANVTSTAKFLRDTGALVVLLTEPCRSFTAGSGWESGGVAQLKRGALNTAKKNLAKYEPNILCVDSDKYIMAPSGDAKPNYLWDGTHFGANSAYYWALAIYEVLSAYIPTVPVTINPQDLYDVTYNPRGNLIPNPTFSSTASGFVKSALPAGVTAFNITNNADGTTTFTVTTNGTGTNGALVSLLYSSPIVGNTNDAFLCNLKVKSITQSDTMLGLRAFAKAAKTGYGAQYTEGFEKYIKPSYPISSLNFVVPTTIPLLVRAPVLVVPYSGASMTFGMYVDVNAAVAGNNIFTVEGIEARYTDFPWTTVGVKQDTGYLSQPWYPAA